MPTSSLNKTSEYTSNVLVGDITNTTNQVFKNLESTSNLFENQISYLQNNMNFSKGARVIEFEQPTIIDNGIIANPTLIDEKYVYVFNNVGSNNYINFPQNSKANVLVVGGGGAGAPNIGGGGAGGGVIIGENLDITGKINFQIFVGKGGSGSNIEDGTDSYAFGALAKGGKAGTTLVINQDGSTIGGKGGNLVESYVINNSDVFKENKYITGLKNSSSKSAIALDIGFNVFFSDTTNMICWYKFDGDYTDSSGNGYHLTNTNSLINTNEKVKGTSCVDLTPPASKLLNTSSYNYGADNGITFCFWFKLTSYVSQSFYASRLFSASPNSQSNDRIIIDADLTINGSVNNNISYTALSGSSVKIFNTGYKAPLNTWVHVAFVLNKSPLLLQCYVNGDLQSTTSDTYYPLSSLLYHTNIGTDHNKSFNFKGYIDDYRIYNRVLTPDEIYVLYNGEFLIDTGTTQPSLVYYAGGGSGSGTEATDADYNLYPDGGSGVKNTYIIKDEYGKGGGGGSTISYGYGGGRGIGKNSSLSYIDALPNTGNGGGGGKQNSSIGGSGASGFVAVIWDKIDVIELSNEEDLNMSNYVSVISPDIDSSILILSNYIVNGFQNTSNDISDITPIIDSYLINMNTNIISQGTSNKFITNNTWDDNLVINGTLITSNARIVGSNIVQYVQAFETNDLSIVSTAEELDAFTIIHSGIGSNNAFATYIVDYPAMIITSNGNVGIGTSSASSKFDIVGNMKIAGNILPTSNEIYDIGTIDTKIHDLYLSQATIHMGINTKISAKTDDNGNLTVSDSTGNLKGITASSFKLRDDNVSTTNSFSMKVKNVGNSKKITFLSEDNLTSQEEQIATSSQFWSNNNINQIIHGNTVLNDDQNSISFGENTLIDNETIKITNNGFVESLLTEDDISCISFHGKDALENEVINNVFDISNVVFKKSGRNPNIFHRTFDISIISNEKELLYAFTIIRSYIYNSTTQRKEPDGIYKDISFSYYSLNTILDSINFPNSGFVFNNHEIWFEIVNDIEYLKLSISDNCSISIVSY